MRVEAYSRLLEYTVRDIVFVLYCHCYVQCVQSTGADLQICEKHIFIIRWLQKKLQRLT